MIRSDRELLADLARMNTDVAALAMRIMDRTASTEEQQTFADRLLDLGTRLGRRARTTMVIDTAPEP